MLLVMSLLILLVISTVNSETRDINLDVSCYECITDKKHKGDCAVVGNNSLLSMICPRDKNYCVKKIVRRHNFVYIERGCVDILNEKELGCMFMKLKTGEEETLCICSGNNCNSTVCIKSSTFGATLIIIGLLALV